MCFTLYSDEAWEILIDNSTIVPIDKDTFRLLFNFEQKVRIYTLLNSMIYHAKDEDTKRHLQDLYLFLTFKYDVVIRKPLR